MEIKKTLKRKTVICNEVVNINRHLIKKLGDTLNVVKKKREKVKSLNN